MDQELRRITAGFTWVVQLNREKMRHTHFQRGRMQAKDDIVAIQTRNYCSRKQFFFFFFAQFKWNSTDHSLALFLA
jgi:hypothetical protein